ncbi:MAG TPA: hypothetical protein VNA22_05590 [Pyrinomonadaceae bacterium]|nr:hypothetical protein [Pyrinomonadaceae bacterium]
MRKKIAIGFAAVAMLAIGALFSVEGQTKRRKPPVKKAAVVTPDATPGPAATEPMVAKPEPKKNERPASSAQEKPATSQTTNGTTYYYEFKQSEFEISKIVIQHDETGRGTITFTKRMFGDSVTDPLQVSAASLERINAAYATLNFIDSNESYQYEKDYSHLGTMTFGLKKADKHRTAAFNYTTHKDAKLLADEYRRLGNQFIWVFEITVARENQPLESPKLLDSLDELVRRNEISDPNQMVPLLNELTNDERIPLIARNHARKLAEKIGKEKKK